MDYSYELLDSEKRSAFEKTDKIPINLLAVAMIKHSIYLQEENIVFVYRSKLPANLISLAKDVIKKITEYFGSTYVSSKVIGRVHHHAIIPDYPYNIDDISSWGLILYK